MKNIKLGDLKLGKKLGNGQFGEVYESKIEGDDTIYATKKLIKSRYERNPKAYRYLENEIKILKQINHENIVKLYNSDLEDRKYRYLITEYCNGGDLDTILEYYMTEKNRPFNEEEVQYIMRQLVNGIKYLHSKTETKEIILHRDLKLENILLRYDNEEDRINKRILKAKIKIIDFGFARYLNDELAQSVLGSPMFMDPRILLKLNKMINTNDFAYEQKADIYSLGIICYSLLTGHQLYDVKRMEDLVKQTEEGIYRISSDLSKETISFLNYMLRYDPKKRLDIDQLSKHKFITKEVKDFTKIDRSKLSKENLEASHLVFNLKKSKIDYLDKSMIEDKEKEEKLDEFQEELKEKFNKIKISNNPIEKKEEEEEKNEIIVKDDIEKFIWESIDIMNSDAMSIEPKLVPFIPGVNPDILLKKN